MPDTKQDFLDIYGFTTPALQIMAMLYFLHKGIQYFLLRGQNKKGSTLKTSFSTEVLLLG